MGWFATPLEHLQKLVASSETFQAVVNKGSEELAKSKVLIWSPDDELPEESIPRAIVGPTGNRKVTKTSTTGWRLSGGLVVMFEFVVPADKQTSRAVAHKWFSDTLDLIVDEIINQSGKDGYLAIESLIEFEPPDFVDTDDTNGVWEMNATYIVTT
ncbi:MAG: hypothetical protein KDA77_00090 [Planctomycetaceae bacterium]|nr:hypothetical protein [Planctomycetaceae bacterium]